MQNHDKLMNNLPIFFIFSVFFQYTRNLKHNLISHKMYFIVHLIQSRENIVAPHSWISAVNLHIEHFINNGVNNNIKLLVFWTDKAEAFDENGTPRVDFEPNAQAGLSSQFPNESWYQCYIRQFNREY